MIKTLHYLLVLLIASASAMAQHYRIAPDSGEVWAYKLSSGKQLVFLKRADQDPGSRDTALMARERSYFFDKSTAGEEHIGYVNGDSYIGHKVIQNGIRIQLHYLRDSIIFKVKDSLSFTNSSNHNFKVVLDSTAFAEVLKGVLDTVRYFQVHRTDSAGNTSVMDGSLALARNNGLVGIPADLCRKSFAVSKAGKFRRVDFTRPALSDFFDYQVGDELHYRFHPQPSPDPYYSNHYCTGRRYDSVEDRMVFEWRIVTRDTTYQNQKMVLRNYSQPAAPYSFHPDSLQEILTSKIRGSSLPVVKWYSRKAGAMDSADFWVEYLSGEQVRNDSIFGDGLWSGYFGSKHFRQNVGIDTLCRRFYSGSSYNDACEFLVYYQLGNRQWGDPRYVGLEARAMHANEVQLYPNPVGGQLTVEFEQGAQPGELMLLDISGNRIRRIEIQASQQSIPVANLPKGLYFLQWQEHSMRFVKK